MTNEMKQDSKFSMIKRDRLSNYSIASRASSQPVFQRVGRLASQLDAFESCRQKDNFRLTVAPSASRSNSPSGNEEDLYYDYEDDEEEQAEGEAAEALGGEGEEEGEEGANRENLNGEGAKHQGGPLGIFFKVWSLVKVTKMRHSKLRRQNSESASQFHYISGEQFNNGANNQQQSSARASARDHRRPISLLQDHHFRHSASHHQLSSSASGRPTPTGQLANSSGRQKKGSPQTRTSNTGSNSTSSGVSSSNNSTLANCSPLAKVALVDTSKLALPADGLAGFNGSRGTHTRGNSVDGGSELEPGELFVPELKAGQEMGEQEEEEEEGEDIYSTPNDSVQSVPSTAPLVAAGGNPFKQPGSRLGQKTNTFSKMSKSFSANNFSQLVGNLGSSVRLAKEPKRLVSSQLGQKKSSIASSRFFISSSSSEDSSCPVKPPAGSAPGPEVGGDEGVPAADFRRQELAQQAGVHAHPAGALASSHSFYGPPLSFVPVLQQTQLGAHVAAMSPVDCALEPASAGANLSQRQRFGSAQYKKSPSLFEMASLAQPQAHQQQQLATRFGSRWPIQKRAPLSSFRLGPPPMQVGGQQRHSNVQNPPLASVQKKAQQPSELPRDGSTELDHYRLAEMLLEYGQNKEAADENGNTALMQAVLSDNLPAVKCLIEHGFDVNRLNGSQMSCLDLLCSRPPNGCRLQMLRLLIGSGADFERATKGATRILDRLIRDHFQGAYNDKLPYIDCLLENGAKLSSSTWQAASGKHEVQLRLARKICSDGYFLYKEMSIEQAVYRFEYALRRLAELESQIFQGSCSLSQASNHFYLASQNQNYHQLSLLAAKRLKFQLYLGLSRAERKRKFFKRALEFAQMSILIDSTSYEGFYSKANILSELGELDEALVAIEQSSQLVENSLETLQMELKQLQQQQEELLIFDGCFGHQQLSPLQNDSLLPASLEPASARNKAEYMELAQAELHSNLDYLCQVRAYINMMKQETLERKLKEQEAAGAK